MEDAIIIKARGSVRCPPFNRDIQPLHCYHAHQFRYRFGIGRAKIVVVVQSLQPDWSFSIARSQSEWKNSRVRVEQPV